MSRRQKFADRRQFLVAGREARYDVSRRDVLPRLASGHLGRRQARVRGAKIRELVGPRRLRAGGPVDPVEDRLRAGEVKLARDDEESSPVWRSTSASGARQFFTKSFLYEFSAMARPSWLDRAVRNEHHHAIEQASRRWRFSTNAP